MKDQKSHGNHMRPLVNAFATPPYPVKIISRISTPFQNIHLVARPMQNDETCLCASCTMRPYSAIGMPSLRLS